MIIGFVGRATSGKDTAGYYIAKQLQGDVQMHAFAQPIKDELADMFNIPHEYFHNQSLKLKPLPQANNKTTRQLMQWWGTQQRLTKGDNYWISRLDQKLTGDFNIITDVRFPEEGFYILKKGGILIYMDRDKVIDPIPIDAHRSEIAVYQTKQMCNHFVDNNGDIEQLEKQLDGIVQILNI